MKTQHTETCKRVFSRYDATCARCQELANGAPARKGWKSEDAQRVREIRQHDCGRSGCGSVCTFGDW